MAVFVLLFFLLLIAYAWLIQFYYSGWKAIPPLQTGDTEPSTPVSVIIALRNERHNIEQLTNDLNAQQFPPALLEIILVDDHSEDDTAALIEAAIHHSRFRMRLIKMEEHGGEARVSGKKKALDAGIRASAGRLIVTTDADCRFGPNWLWYLVRFQECYHAQFIAAPVKMEGKQSLLTAFQSLDFLTLQGITGASVFRRFHDMCNGANLLYTRSAFDTVNGFEGIDLIPSGDDMFLMHKVRKKFPDRIYYLKHQEAIVTTAAEPGWRAFLQQRIRWASKAVHYEDKHLFTVLASVYALNACYVLMALALFWHPLAGAFLFLFLLAKVLIEFPFVLSAARFFGQGKWMPWFILFQPVHIIYILVSGWLGRFGSYQWKGRTIKKPKA